MKTFKELYEACCAACEKRAEIEEVKEPTGDLKDACWKGYTAVGMKMKNGRKVPNCVPVKEDAEQIDEIRGIGNEESYDEKMHKQDASKMRNIASKLQAKLDAIQKPKSQAAHTKALKGMSKTPVAQFLKTRKGDGTVRTEEVEQIDEISTGKKMAVAYRAGKRYIAARNMDASLRRSGAHRLADADVTDKKKIINTIRRSGTLGKLASIAGAVKKTYGEETELEEGYTLKKVSMDKHTVPGNSDDYSPDVKVKETSYHIVHNKTGKKVGTAHLSSDNYFGHGKLHVKMNDGTQRHLEMNGKDPQAAINKFIKHPKTSSKYKVQEESELEEGYMMAAAASANQPQYKERTPEEEKKHAERKAEKYLHMPGKNAAKKRKYWVKKVNKLHGIPEEVEQIDEMDKTQSQQGGHGVTEPYDYDKGKWSKARIMTNKEVAKKVKFDVSKLLKIAGGKKKVKEETKPGKNVVPPHVGALATGGIVKEATYQGKEVPLNKPMAGDVKKSKVYVDPDGDGKAQKVNFGDKNMTIKKHIPGRRKNFRARHNCDNPGPKTKARYWSCKAW